MTSPDKGPRYHSHAHSSVSQIGCLDVANGPSPNLETSIPPRYSEILSTSCQYDSITMHCNLKLAVHARSDRPIHQSESRLHATFDTPVSIYLSSSCRLGIGSDFICANTNSSSWDGLLDGIVNDGLYRVYRLLDLNL